MRDDSKVADIYQSVFGEEVVLEEGVVWLKIRDMLEVSMHY